MQLVAGILLIFFFVCKQKTAYEMRISDWSSDVCSSDLISAQAAAGLAQAIRQQIQPCWNPPAGGEDVAKLVTILRIQFRKDGTVVGQPQVTDQAGVTGNNQSDRKSTRLNSSH